MFESSPESRCSSASAALPLLATMHTSGHVDAAGAGGGVSATGADDGAGASEPAFALALALGSLCPDAEKVAFAFESSSLEAFTCTSPPPLQAATTTKSPIPQSHQPASSVHSTSKRQSRSGCARGCPNTAAGDSFERAGRRLRLKVRRVGYGLRLPPSWSALRRRRSPGCACRRSCGRRRRPRGRRTPPRG